ncbi:MAG TPA: S41 family peptidase [Gemmatirosa sp.]
MLQQSMRFNRPFFRSPSRRQRAALGLSALATAVGVAACTSKSDTTTGPSAGLSPVANAYIESALSYEAGTDYWWSRVDSVSQRSDVFRVAGAAQVDSQAWNAVERSIVPWLQNADPAPGGDQHSAFFRASDAPGVVNSPGSSAQDNLAYLTSGKNFPLSGTTNNVGYLWLPTYDGTNDTGRADSIQTVIRTLDQNSPCGWIIDLRYNPGGTWAAMFDGINPILGNAPYGGGQQGFLGLVDRDGVKSYFFLQNGAAGITTPGQNDPRYDTVYTRASSNYTLKRPGSPVAILQGGNTASAGEEIVLAFRGVSFPVRTFGANTYGVTTVPSGYYMYELDPGADSSYLNIVNAIDIDRTGKLWGGPIPPTVAVAGPADTTFFPATSATADPVVQAATQWLQTQTSCGGTAVASRSEVPSPVFSVAPVAGTLRKSTAASGAPRRRPSKFHVAQGPRSRLRARVSGRRVLYGRTR